MEEIEVPQLDSILNLGLGLSIPVYLSVKTMVEAHNFFVLVCFFRQITSEEYIAIFLCLYIKIKLKLTTLLN